MTLNGCRWQEKSFSVSMTMSGNCVCIECGKPTDEKYRYNGDMLCGECFSKKGRINNSFIPCNFNTDKDLSYRFVSDMFDGNPIQIYSKRQFKSLLKQHGLADASPKEVRQEAAFRRRVNIESDNIARRKTAENIFDKKRDLLRFRRKRR